MTWKKGRVSLTEPAFHTCSAPTANRKGCRGVALWGLTQLQPEVTSSTFTNLSMMHPTGTGALMLLSSLQATVSRHAGRAEKWDGAIERTSIKEGKLETRLLPPAPSESWRANMQSYCQRKGEWWRCADPPKRVSNTTAKQSSYSFRPAGFLREGNGLFHIILLNSLIH